MNVNILHFLPTVLLIFTVTRELVAGCERNWNETECLADPNCKYHQCGNVTQCVNSTEELKCLNVDAANADVIIQNSNHETSADHGNASINSGDIAPNQNKTTSNATATGAIAAEASPITTTTAAAASSSTSAPTTSTPSAPPSSTAKSQENPNDYPPPSSTISRRFDGPSFMGGIVLAFGLMAITYVGLKFYRARTERNYHTLHEMMRESNYSTLPGH